MGKPKAKKKASETAKPAKGRGSGRKPPPKEHQFKAGNPGGPGRPPNAGATIIEWWNILVAADPTEEELQQLAKYARPLAKRMAALEILQTLERADLADFAEYLSGEKTLPELRKAGLPTSLIRKASNHPGKYGDARGLELHDRRGTALDRILDRTLGRPKQAVEVKGDGLNLQSDADRADTAARILLAIRAGLGPGSASADPDPAVPR